MSKSTHKSAAVPFVNDKGERSMKRVKVERYVAGKKPAYAIDEDDESIYDSEEEVGPDAMIDEESEEVDDQGSIETEPESSKEKRCITNNENPSEGDDDEDDDDPRFRKLRTVNTCHIPPKYEQPANKTVIIEEDDDDNEEEVRRRHMLARSRKIEEPLGAKIIFGEDKDARPDHISMVGDEDDEDDLVSRYTSQVKKIDTDDLLKDFVPTGFGLDLGSSGQTKTEEERKSDEKRLKEALEQAKLEVKFTQQVNKKIEEDLKRELEREAMAKGDIGAHEMTSVNTDDEDDEIAYEEWKLREIKRVLRDRSERMLESSRRTANKVL